ncbi:unnamed protein product [Echinostoma caproni]|uniref:CCDC92 domain-containing protein n=1 Tax=Echinostoma caproni TaxID=27848 RepID=A0A183AL98_9TREM|nr:unnamed protein product [Echinostoma caproni]
MENKGSVGSWTRDQLEDQYLRLYDDFLTLKKHCCKQEDRIKQMATKILRLANDKKGSSANAVWEDDYREQIEALERKNSALSQKFIRKANVIDPSLFAPIWGERFQPNTGRTVNRANMRTLAGTPKHNRSKESGATGALQTVRIQNAAFVGIELVEDSTPSWICHLSLRFYLLALVRREQTVKKLSEQLQDREKIIVQLKEELQAKDSNHQQDMHALMQQLTSKQRDTLKENIDLIRNQRELREKQLQIVTLQARIQDFEADQSATKEANRKLVSEVERLTNEIALLEQKNIQMESASNLATKDHLKVLERLIVKGSNNTGGMNVQPAELEVDGEPVFLKRRVILYDQREGVLQALEKMKRDGIIT